MTDLIPESSGYDNYLDETKNKDDIYRTALDRFTEEAIETPIFHDRKLEKEKPKDHVRLMKVHLWNIEDHLEFCNRVGQVIPYEMNDIYFPLEGENSLFSGDETRIENIDINLIRPKRRTPEQKKNITSHLGFEDDPTYVGDKEWMKHWHGMPDFIQEHCDSYKQVYVKIRTDDDLKKFAELTGNTITDKTKFMHFPKIPKSVNLAKRWIGEVSIPKYPMYIISKGRHESMVTSRTFAELKIPHYIIIEPQDEQNYIEALENFKINPYATLLVAPFSNHGDGPGRARNWAWDHSISMGAERHWVFDDNIKDFYRLHLNHRYRAMTGSIFNAMEDFVDRYENIMIAGPQYYFFCANTQKYPPYVANTRIYSALLIQNNCRHRWRGRYNEDTDLSLRVLKDGDATLQFNAFLQGKMGTQLLKGGNTAEFYHAEGEVEDKTNWRGGSMNSSGTINKSKMLVDMHPDVAKLVWKYDRWHHHVDYGGFAKNKLILKPGVELPYGKIDNYGMEFTENYSIED